MMHEVMRYRSRLSGPLLDRIDIHIEVPPVPLSLLQRKSDEESSASIRERVIKARQVQFSRFGSDRLNSQMRRQDLEDWAWPDGQALGYKDSSLVVINKGE